MPYCGFVLRDCIRMPPARDIFPIKTSHAVRSTVYQCEYLVPPILKKSPHGSESILFITQWPGTPEIYSGPGRDIVPDGEFPAERDSPGQVPCVKRWVILVHQWRCTLNYIHP